VYIVQRQRVERVRIWLEVSAAGGKAFFVERRARRRVFAIALLQMPPKKTLAPVLSVLNMKGGVGKTTVAANIFREFYRRMEGVRKTLLVDFDAQHNLTQQVISRKKHDELEAEKRTLWHLFEPTNPPNLFEVNESRRTDVGDYSKFLYELKSNVAGDQLLLLPGDFRIALLNLREKPESLEMPRKRFQDFIRKAREDCALVVLDCNPSSSFLTRAAIEASTHLLVPVRPDRYSILGLELLDQYMTYLPLPEPPKLMIIMNATRAHGSSVEAELRRHPKYGADVLVTRIPETDVLVARAEYTGFGVDRTARGTSRRVPYSEITRKILVNAADEIGGRLKLL
jgi:chromosome partitioning protein